MAVPARSHSAEAVIPGLLLGAVLVGGAFAAGRMPRESSEYPGIVLDELPPSHWDGPTRVERAPELGLTLRLPEDAFCTRDELGAFVCRHARLDIVAAWRVDALRDAHDERAELEAARRGPLVLDTESRIVRLAGTTGILVSKGCGSSATDACRSTLSFVGWYGEGERRTRLWIEIVHSPSTSPEVPLAVLASTELTLPSWDSLRAQGKSPAIRPERRAELLHTARSRTGRVTLRAPAGSTCTTGERNVRCYGRDGWYASVSLFDTLRTSTDRYPSVAEWARGQLARARKLEPPVAGELTVLASMTGVVVSEGCAAGAPSDAPCRLRAVLQGVPSRDQISAQVIGEISAANEADLELGWAALDSAELAPALP